VVDYGADASWRFWQVQQEFGLAAVCWVLVLPDDALDLQQQQQQQHEPVSITKEASTTPYSDASCYPTTCQHASMWRLPAA
jgi:hypothetical protein